MHIGLRLADDIKDWFIIEIQGQLEFREIFSSLNDKYIGDLFIKTQENGDIPVLTVGHHLLFGKFQDLDKPLAVMTKCVLPEEKCSSSNNIEYVIKAFVKKKLVFKTRPKPIVADTTSVSSV